MDLQQTNCQVMCGFAFPKGECRLLKMDSIGFISDSALYQMNMSNGQVQISYHTQGRSYQALTSNHKRGILVLADYGKNPTIFFQFVDGRQKPFSIIDVCRIQVKGLELSMDSAILAVICGFPDHRIQLIDVNAKQLFKGKYHIPVNKKIGELKNIQFNPNNNRILVLQYPKHILVYQIQDTFELGEDKNIEQGIITQQIMQLTADEDEQYQTILWDELNNIYISSRKQIFVYNMDSKNAVIRYDLQVEIEDGAIVANMLLTLKHLIVFYSNGRVEWLNKYSADWMDEEEVHLRPFYQDKYLQLQKNVTSSMFNHHFSKIFAIHPQGYFSVIPKQAETHEADQEDQDNQDKAKSNSVQKKLNLNIKFLGPYHRATIVLVREIQGTSCCMTLCKQGRLIIWSIVQSNNVVIKETQVGHAELKCRVESADLNTQENVLGVALPNGVLQFYSVANIRNVYLFKEFRITNGTPIKQLAFSTDAQQMALFDQQSNRIYYILTSLSTQFQIIGYINLPHAIQHICWNNNNKIAVKPNYEYLLVCVSVGIYMINSPLAQSSSKRGQELELDCNTYGLRVEGEPSMMAVLPSGQIMMTGQDSLLKKYKQPEQPLSKMQFKSKSAVTPLQVQPAHNLPITYILPISQQIVTASADGTLQIRPYHNITQCKTIIVYGWSNNNFALLGNSKQSIVYACGNDGSVYVIRLSGKLQMQNKNVWQIKSCGYEEIKPKGQDLKHFKESIDDEYLLKMKDVIMEKKKAHQNKLQLIKKELQTLLQQNKSHEELQQLPRDQFAIDLHSREQVAKAGRQKCNAIRQSSRKKIIFNEVYAKKLKEITWDRMKVHIKAINGLKHNIIVYNYHIRHVSPEKTRKVKLILNLRRTQKKIDRKRGTLAIDPDFYRNKNVVNAGVVQPLILTVYEKKDEKEEKIKKKQPQEIIEKPQQNEQIHFEEEWSLLYSSFELYSNNAKRNQILMMKNIILLTKQVFNKEFETLMKLRQSQNELINDKNKRIIEICFDLKRQAQIVLGRKNILESSDDVLEVSTNQIPFERYLSKQERQKLQKQRLKEEERLRKLAQDDSSQRALQKMMSGTLEEKKTSILENVVQRQKWMDKPVDEMNDDERLKLKEFQQKKQKADEEKERIVKKLEAELRKLKQQIDDIMEKYDEKLFTLLRRRIQYDTRIEEQEIYCAQLIMEMVGEQEEAARKQIIQKDLANKMKSLQMIEQTKEEISKYEEVLQRQKQSKRALIDNRKLGELQSKIKTIQKSVFEQYQNNLKKRRQMQERLLESSEVIRNQIIPMDPMKEIQSRLLSAQKSKEFDFFIEEIKAMQQTFDIPDSSFLQILQNRFNVRNQESEYLHKINIIKNTIVNLQNKLQTQQSIIAADETDITEIQKFLQQSKSDLAVLCRLKQGQIQINNDKPVPELWNGLLLSKAEIDERNSNIMKHANQKIQVMQKIKTCKISVTQETLNMQKKQDLISKLTGMIKQIQMLKVKKEMQVALAKKDTRINEKELGSLKEQTQKVRKEGHKRVELFRNKIENIIREIQNIRKENKQLEVQRWNLQSTVGQREKIKNMMCGQNGDNNNEATQKFGQIAINRKLFDKAKQQTQEIQLLREELSKLKAKTFANFSNIQK